MRFHRLIHAGGLIAVSVLAVVGQTPPAETKGIPPRAAPSDYQSQAPAGQITIAAEFTGHSVPTMEGPLTTEEFVVVEVALFGPAGSRLNLAPGHFSLRFNGKKVLESQPYGLIVASLKDPEWVPPEQAAPKSKTSIGGGQGQQASGPPEPPQIPLPVRRAMAQRVQKAVLAEGDRPLPQAGLLFFQQRGKLENLHSVELLYDGPAGKTLLKLQP